MNQYDRNHPVGSEEDLILYTDQHLAEIIGTRIVKHWISDPTEFLGDRPRITQQDLDDFLEA